MLELFLFGKMLLEPTGQCWYLTFGIWQIRLRRLRFSLKLYRQYRPFTVYLGFCCLRTAVLFVIFLSTMWIDNERVYAEIYAFGRLIGMVLLAWIVADLFRRPWFALASIPVMAYQAIWFSVQLNRWYGFAICTLLLVALLKHLIFRRWKVPELSAEQKAIAIGIFISMLFPSIAGVRQMYTNSAFNATWRYVPTVSFLLAQVVWLRAFWLPRLKPC